MNQSASMMHYKGTIREILNSVMTASEDMILNSDRVSLIKYDRRLRRVFSLVQKDSNFA